MSDIKKSTWGGARPGAGRPRKHAATAAPTRELSVVELVREPEARGAIVVTTPQGVRIEGLTFEQMLRLLGGFA